MNYSMINQYQLYNRQNVTSLTTTEYLTTSHKPTPNRSYGLAFKLLTIFSIVFVFGMIIIRLCFKFCSSNRSSNVLSSIHGIPVIRPQVSTIELPYYKPDLPPAYPEAIANIDNDETKLPSYDELQNEQNVRSTNPTQT
ncbi:unnamed protein product [Rotaria sp. Silwood1]|nr:unnamed protein product [Rotaria sp. Silwood1]CAF3782468.1 unnamed protein product [Rotaria sp. Silwood1]CAF4805587.1 unnamed protein product [Rotaria sp. Silwood1]